MKNVVYNVLNDMSDYLDISQMKHLQEILINRLSDESDDEYKHVENLDYVDLFLSAKNIEGCTKRIINYYQSTLFNRFEEIKLPIGKIATEVIRVYLIKYQSRNNCGKTTLDNVRRNLSSFFSWLEEEDYILKNPIRHIHKVKTGSIVKKVITDESIELMRGDCLTLRDLALIDLLYSTGIRVGELVNLNVDDVNFEMRECIVYGKGDKE